jgi:hypothetical protein
MNAPERPLGSDSVIPRCPAQCPVCLKADEAGRFVSIRDLVRESGSLAARSRKPTHQMPRPLRRRPKPDRRRALELLGASHDGTGKYMVVAGRTVEVG